MYIFFTKLAITAVSPVNSIGVMNGYAAADASGPMSSGAQVVPWRKWLDWRTGTLVQTNFVCDEVI